MYKAAQSNQTATLKDLEEEFQHRLFRIHRNCLVSLNHVHGMEKIEQNQYVVSLEGVELKPLVSRRHVTELRKKLRSM